MEKVHPPRQNGTTFQHALLATKQSNPNHEIANVYTAAALTHSLTQPFTYSLTHSRTHSLTHSLTRSLTLSLLRSLTRSRTHSRVTHSLTHSLTHNVARGGGCASAVKVGAATDQDAINMVSDSSHGQEYFRPRQKKPESAQPRESRRKIADALLFATAGKGFLAPVGSFHPHSSRSPEIRSRSRLSSHTQTL